MKRRRSMPALCVAIAMLIAGCAVSVPDDTVNEPENIKPQEDTVSPNVTNDDADVNDGTEADSQYKGSEEHGEEVDVPEKQEPESAADSKNEDGESESDAPAGSIGSAGTALTGARPSTSGQLSVDGTSLVGADGSPVQLRGISTHGLAWYPDYVNSACFNEISSEWGANAVRLAMYTAEYGGYCTGGDKDALKKLIMDGVQYAADADMYVIVDWHILSDGNPDTYKSEALKFFSDMSAELADYSNVLYEICNEPNGGTSWSTIKAYAEDVIAVIRENDDDAVILVGTPNWSQYVDEAVKDPITDYDNIMYTLHFYAATHKDGLRNTMVAAIDAGLPVFVSEYGICDASGNGALDTVEAGKWVETMDSYGVSYMAWNLSNKAESSALIKSSCAKSSGFSEDDLSDSGKWLLDMLGGALEVSKGDKGTETQEPQTGPSQQKPVHSGDGSGITWDVSLANSWESGGETYYQYVLTVTNSSESDISTWKAELKFSGEFELHDSWNGDFSVSGRTMTISSKDYNGALASGSSASDIGFIISGGANLKLA